MWHTQNYTKANMAVMYKRACWQHAPCNQQGSPLRCLYSTAWALLYVQHNPVQHSALEHTVQLPSQASQTCIQQIPLTHMSAPWIPPSIPPAV
jgi:hypothetical protein